MPVGLLGNTTNVVIRVRGSRAAIQLDGALPRMVLVMILDASSSCLAQLYSQRSYILNRPSYKIPLQILLVPHGTHSRLNDVA